MIHQTHLEMARPRPAEGLDLHEVKDGFIIYHAIADRVHYLNPTAALIFELCDGSRSEEEIARIVGQAFDLGATPGEEVRDTIRQMMDETLLCT